MKVCSETLEESVLKLNENIKHILNVNKPEYSRMCSFAAVYEGHVHIYSLMLGVLSV